MTRPAKSLRIVCLAGCDWTASWQPTQEIMTRLAEQGHQILYIDPTGTRTVRLREWRRVWHRLKAKWFHSYPQTAYRGYGLQEEVLRIQHHPNITLYHPLLFPWPLSRVWTILNRHLLMRRIRRWLAGAQADVLWAWFPSPLNADLKRALQHRISIFQIMSSIQTVRPHAAIREAEREMLDQYELIFVNSATLQKQVSHPDTYLFRAGVDTVLFNPYEAHWVGRYSKERPADLPTGKPIIMYVGSLHEWFDRPLWERLKRHLPDYHCVLITGKPHPLLPLYVFYADVCVIPYRADAYTATSFPAKLNEYLAMGKPVVATRTAELEAFELLHGIRLGLSRTLDDWIDNILAAMASPDQSAHFRQIALGYDYTTQIQQMLALIHEQHP